MDPNDLYTRLEEAVRALRDALAACEELARHLAASSDREAVRDALLPEIERAERRGR